MDYDGDGLLDFISGSYDPGDVYLFRGLGKGEYAAVTVLKDEAGVPIVHHPEQLVKFHEMQKNSGSDPKARIQARVASFGSWAHPVDWDADGDLDLLIGTFGGELYRRENIGTRKVPVYSEESVCVEADGEPMRVLGHADPVPADWDGDGRWDLVVGSSDGSVRWYENTGEDGVPKFEAGRILVEAKSESKFLQQFLEPDDPIAPGVRAQICVEDYDGDGRLDLIVGDYSSVVELRDLDEPEHEQFQQLLAAESELNETIYTADEGADTTAEEAELEAIAEEKQHYLRSKSSEKREPSSFLWLYLREKKVTPADSSGTR